MILSVTFIWFILFIFPVIALIASIFVLMALFADFFKKTGVMWKIKTEKMKMLNKLYCLQFKKYMFELILYASSHFV